MKPQLTSNSFAPATALACVIGVPTPLDRGTGGAVHLGRKA